MDTDAPVQSYRLIRKFVPGFMQPLLRGARKRFFDSSRPTEEPYRTVFPYTLVHPARQKHLVHLVLDIENRNVPGVMIECGVLDGGTAALLAFASVKSSREVHLFDSWQGLPASTAEDSCAAKAWVGEAIGSQTRVRSVMRRLNIDAARITFHKGWFHQTFPKAKIDRVALVHIDADFYESVRLSTETWYPRLSPGGYMQFDDYSAFIGCRRAVDEFLSTHPELSLQNEKGIVFFIQKPHP